MTQILLIISASLLLCMQTIGLRQVKVATFRDNILVTGIFSGLIVLGLGVGRLFSSETFSGATLLFGFLFGIVFIITIAFYYYAMSSGPLSYTAFFFSASMLIPAVAGVVVWKEPLTGAIVVGGGLFLTAFYCISVLGGDKGKKGSVRWLLLCFGTWVSNGSLTLLVKTQQTLQHGTESASMMLISFASACVVSFIVYFVLFFLRKDAGSVRQDFARIRTCTIALLAVAVGTGAGNTIVTYLTSRVPIAYLYPFVLGGSMVGVTLYSLFVLKEKINRFGVVGVALALSAIVVINL